MNRIAKLVAILILCALCVAVFVACSSRDDNSFSITLELNGGNGVSAQDFIYDGKLTEPANRPMRKGYTFAGWFFDRNFTDRVTFGRELKSNITIYAAWTENEVVATFVLGSWTEEIRLAALDGKFAPPQAARDGYNFLGWFTDLALSQEANFDEEATADRVFYAKWQVIEYNITYELSDLATVGVNARHTYTIEDLVSLPAPGNIARGYDFVAWLDENGEEVDRIPKGSMGDRALTAVFLSHNNYVIRTIGGSTVGNTVNLAVPYSASSLDLSEVIRLSPRATAEFYRGTQKIEPVVTIDGDLGEYIIKVIAEAGDVRSYNITVTRYPAGNKTVTFDGLYSREETVETGATIAEPTATERDGYNFLGWFADDEYTKPFNFDMPILEDTVIYGRYETIEYSITYVLEMGENDPENPTIYTVESAIVLFDAVAPEGYVFDGWYDADGNRITEITAGSLGNITLYARFTAVGGTEPQEPQDPTEQEGQGEQGNEQD